MLTWRIDKDKFFRLIMEFPQMAVQISPELAHRIEKSHQLMRAEPAFVRLT